MSILETSAPAELLAPEGMRRWLGSGVVAITCGLALLWLVQRNATGAQSHVSEAFVAGLVAAAATAFGTLPILFTRTISTRVRDTLLGFGAGVMLAATAFSLVLPALAAASATGVGTWGSGLIVASGVLLGAALLLALKYFAPNEDSLLRAGGSPQLASALRRTWLFVFAVSLHNLPEGMAIGVGYAGSSHAGATTLATGIAIQDLPEGLVISLALLAAGYGKGFSILIGSLSGVIEPLGAALGAAIIGTSAVLLPWGLAVAAGAMLYVISHEIIPESHQRGHGRIATAGLMLGFVLMTMLDTGLR